MLKFILNEKNQGILYAEYPPKCWNCGLSEHLRFCEARKNTVCYPCLADPVRTSELCYRSFFKGKEHGHWVITNIKSMESLENDKGEQE